jgi:hypothetical protein
MAKNGLNYALPYFFMDSKNNGGNSKFWAGEETEFLKCKSSADSVSGIAVFAKYLILTEVSADPLYLYEVYSIKWGGSLVNG